MTQITRKQYEEFKDFNTGLHKVYSVKTRNFIYMTEREIVYSVKTHQFEVSK